MSRPTSCWPTSACPACDGYEVPAFVKGRADLAHIPVLLLTGAFEPVDEIRVRDGAGRTACWRSRSSRRS